MHVSPKYDEVFRTARSMKCHRAGFVIRLEMDVVDAPA